MPGWVVVGAAVRRQGLAVRWERGVRPGACDVAATLAHRAVPSPPLLRVAVVKDVWLHVVKAHLPLLLLRQDWFARCCFFHGAEHDASTAVLLDVAVVEQQVRPQPVVIVIIPGRADCPRGTAKAEVPARKRAPQYNVKSPPTTGMCAVGVMLQRD